MVYGVIYGLYDPRSGALRYVGQTTLTLERRLQSHLTPKNLSRHRHSACWLRSLVQKGLTPHIRALRVAASQEDLDLLEVKLISEAQARGDRLTNHTKGGRGMRGYSLSLETKEKMSQSRLGHFVSSVTRAKISSKHKGRCLTEATKTKLAVAHRNQSTLQLLESRTALSAALPLPPPSKRKCLGPRHPQYRRDVSTDWILRQLRLGASRKQVAEKLGVSSRFIGKRLQQAEAAGIPNIPKSHRGAVPTVTILQKLREGKSRGQVAVELGISVSLVALRLRLAKERQNGG